MKPISAFFATLGFFHCSEFFLAWVFQRDGLSWKSWLLSKHYCIAMAAGVLEYCIELYIAPSVKASEDLIYYVGLCMIISGEALRKTAMVTAQGNFTHDIQWAKRETHQLVTSGIYRYARHPGYLGWMIWAVGTQILLKNPFCAVGFYFVVWQFFKERIRVEERCLTEFFGDEYTTYASRVPVWIPCI